ncbi:hypothetical protein FMUBM48_29130 [Nocardia cyriacigeorgica]|nr:hypothetical protein FMUBM48_29130 [Nocardia cyriacigeorgica]
MGEDSRAPTPGQEQLAVPDSPSADYEKLGSLVRLSQNRDGVRALFADERSPAGGGCITGALGDVSRFTASLVLGQPRSPLRRIPSTPPLTGWACLSRPIRIPSRIPESVPEGRFHRRFDRGSALGRRTVGSTAFAGISAYMPEKSP